MNTRNRWKRNIPRRIQNNADRFFRYRYGSLALNSWRDCNELTTVEFPTVFILYRYRMDARSNFATVTFCTLFKVCQHRVSAVLVHNSYFIIYINIYLYILWFYYAFYDFYERIYLQLSITIEHFWVSIG